MTEDKGMRAAAGLGLVLVFVSAWLAQCFYGKIVKWRYSRLIAAYEEARVIPEIRDRVVPLRSSQSNVPTTRNDLAATLLRLTQTGAQEIEGSGERQMGAFEETSSILLRSINSDDAKKIPLADGSTLFQIIALICDPKHADSACDTANSESRGKNDRILASNLARVLSGMPLVSDFPHSLLPSWIKSLPGFNRLGSEENFGDKFVKGKSKNVLSEIQHIPHRSSFVVLAAPDPPDSKKLLGALARDLVVKIPECSRDNCSDVLAVNYHAAIETAESLLSALNQLDTVDNAWSWLRLVTGAEQLAIIFLAIFLLLTLLKLQIEVLLETGAWSRMQRAIERNTSKGKPWSSTLESAREQFHKIDGRLETYTSKILQYWCWFAAPIADPSAPRWIQITFYTGLTILGLIAISFMSKYWLLVGAGAILAAFYFESRRYGAERFYALKIRREVREKSAADRVSRGHLHDTESVGTSGQTTNEMQRATERMLSDMEEARSIVVWGIGALPALGFIGTVRGIMQALGSADKLTQPGATQIELAAGMSDVTARLSLAFSTTLFALLAGLLIGFLLYLQAKQEKRLLNNIGRTLPRMRDEHAE